jgi:chromosome partitioning protein
MITIAVVNTKGGVGKTTLSAALAIRAAADGKRVAIVDMDPQKALIAWWRRRGPNQSDSPQLFEGPDTAYDAVEAAAFNGWDIVILDGPPAFLVVVQEMIQAADFALIPVKPSTVDLMATQDAVALAHTAGVPFLCVFNDVVRPEKAVDQARQFLLNCDIPVARTQVMHRISHINAMSVGKSAAEVRTSKGKDTAAAKEIDDLWLVVIAAATKAAGARKKKVGADG